jgi:hypothetical protein
VVPAGLQGDIGDRIDVSVAQETTDQYGLVVVTL